MARKGHKISNNNSIKHIRKNNKKQTNESFSAHSAFDKNSNRKNYINKSSYYNKSQR